MKSYRYLLAPILYSSILLINQLAFASVVDHSADIERTKQLDTKLFSAAKGVLDLQKTFIDSEVDDLKIPSYIFRPLSSKGNDKHPAIVWVYGGIHDYFGVNYFPFIREAVEQGYVVIAPEYRGASGYGKEYYESLDYGGYEVNDAISAANYLIANEDMVDAERIGIMGWSHGGLISLLAATREAPTLFKAVVAFVPVSNLIFRLSYKGPEYQRIFTKQARISGLPHEIPDVYMQRSPLFNVDKLRSPTLVMVATNDDDADFVETEALINALKVKKSTVANTIIWKDPAHGHYFNRQVDIDTLTTKDTNEQVKAWDITWDFLEKHLMP